MKRFLLILLIVVLSLFTVFYIRITTEDKKAGETVYHTIKCGGDTREFYVHLPIEYSEDYSLPLVIVLHGGGGSAENLTKEPNNQMSVIADKHSFLVVYPQGLGKSWNDDRLDVPSYAFENDIDDVGFISDLIDYMAKEYNADADNVFVTGISNGGGMSLRLSRELPQMIKAAAPVCMNIPVEVVDEHKTSPPINIMVINGTDDKIVPYDGGMISIYGADRGEAISTDKTIEIFNIRNDITSEPTVTELPDVDPKDKTRVIRYEYINTETGNMTVLLKIAGGGHTWPGAPHYYDKLLGMTSQDINASEVIWEFFSNFVE